MQPIPISSEGPSDDYTMLPESQAKTSSSKRAYEELTRVTKTKAAVAAIFAVVSYNLPFMVAEEPYASIFSNLGITLASAYAFSPAGSSTAKKVMKIGLCTLIGQLAILPQLWTKQSADSTLLTSALYSFSLALLWNMAESKQTFTQNTFLQRTLGAITAVGVHKTSQILLNEPLAPVIGNLGIAAGNMLAFPPKREKLHYTLVHIPFIITQGLSAEYLKEKQYWKTALAISVVCSAISLFFIWYHGRRKLLEVKPDPICQVAMVVPKNNPSEALSEELLYDENLLDEHLLDEDLPDERLYDERLPDVLSNDERSI